MDEHVRWRNICKICCEILALLHFSKTKPFFFFSDKSKLVDLWCLKPFSALVLLQHGIPFRILMAFSLSTRNLNPFPCFYLSEVQVLKTRWEKEKLLVTSNFFFPNSVFKHFWRTYQYFRQIWNRHLPNLSVFFSLEVSKRHLGKDYFFQRNRG